MKKILVVLGVLILILIISNQATVKTPPVKTPAPHSANPRVAGEKITTRISHSWKWVTNKDHIDGRNMLIYVAMAAFVLGAALKKTRGVLWWHVLLFGGIFTLLSEWLFAGFLGFNYYLKTSHWQYSNFIVIGLIESVILGIGYAVVRD